MKILVTGGAGFIASHIVDAYIQDGHEVTVVDDLSTGKKENLNSKALFLQIDIQDSNVTDIFKKGNFDMVNHHAAQIDVRMSVSDPKKDTRINVLGLINILENCKKHNVKKVIFSASGGTFYGECGTCPPKEDNLPNPQSPYGINKMVSEYYLRYYAESFGLDFTVLRYGNVYGPRQDPHGEAGVVAIFCGRILNNEDVSIFGNGKQERDYIFVDDIVAVNKAVLTKGKNQVFNIGTGYSASVLELFETLKKYSRKGIKAIHKPPRTGELARSALDVSKAEKELGWKSPVSLREGLEKTYDYFEKQVKT